MTGVKPVEPHVSRRSLNRHQQGFFSSAFFSVIFFFWRRRLWRALSLFSPSLALPVDYQDLVLAPAYPFSVLPDRFAGVC